MRKMTSRCIGVCVLIVCVGVPLSAANLTCGPNEVVHDCPRNCSYNYCPKDEHQDKLPCPMPTVCPPPACECGFNFRRAENGTCIPTELCPPFDCSGPNEIFKACPSYCPGDDCKNSNPTGECLFFSLLVVECSPSCRCIPNYWRKDGVCVPYLECSGVRELLKEYENGKQQTSVENFYIRQFS